MTTRKLYTDDAGRVYEAVACTECDGCAFINDSPECNSAPPCGSGHSGLGYAVIWVRKREKESDMVFKEMFPFGLDKITLHIRGSMQSVTLNPNDPASVYESIGQIMGRDIVKADYTPTENPEFDAWREAVADRETMESFEVWSAARRR